MENRFVIFFGLISFLFFGVPCKAGEFKGVKNFFSKNYLIQFAYPENFQAFEGDTAASGNYLGDRPGNGIKIVKILDPHLDPHFIDRYEINVWVSSNDRCDLSWYEGEDVMSNQKRVQSEKKYNFHYVGTDNKLFPHELSIGNESFHLYQKSDAGLGNRQYAVVYLGTHKGKCWQIQLVENWIAAAEDSQGPNTAKYKATHFNNTEAQNVFHTVLQTFRFRE